mmetsp:Transcript_90322/g.188887  ORF Transcript_90322/g.188887 Transcript_90322/m.188887 type:complete len:83 (+) Transcript_90322:157-405(+)
MWQWLLACFCRGSSIFTQTVETTSRAKQRPSCGQLGHRYAASIRTELEQMAKTIKKKKNKNSLTSSEKTGHDFMVLVMLISP